MKAVALVVASAVGMYISLYFTQLKEVRPLLKGADLIKMGIGPGPVIKRILSDLLNARLDEQILSRDDETAFVSRIQRME